MHLVRYHTTADRTPRVGVLTDHGLARLPVGDSAALWQLSVGELKSLTESVSPHPLPRDIHWLPPIDGRTEVWAAGVTYLRSRDARVEESHQPSIYEQIYDADRPELFFKAPAWRVVIDGEPVAVRSDSADNVPEPELAVVISARGEILGYLVSNDMSSRSIEGENPLYLPQAKVYAGSCALSIGVRPVWEVEADDLAITMVIRRAGEMVFEGATSTSRMRRNPEDLTPHLFRAENFPDGVVLSTGTGVVPELGAGVAVGDEIAISIDRVGTLRNRVVAGRDIFACLAEGGRPTA
jgi:2-dehydro-3-deoxy-D-arabinonate dehydratase